MIDFSGVDWNAIGTYSVATFIVIVAIVGGYAAGFNEARDEIRRAHVRLEIAKEREDETLAKWHVDCDNLAVANESTLSTFKFQEIASKAEYENARIELANARLALA